MSDSSEDDTPLDLRADNSESDDEHPRKRQRTSKILRNRPMGFVQAASRDEDEDEDDIDDARPSFGSFQNSFNIGEYQETKEEPLEAARRSPPRIMRPSAFNKTGKPVLSSFAARQMAKMGYVEGQGLGATGKGIAAPIQAVGTTGRAGLGSASEHTPPQREKKVKTKSQVSTPGDRTPGNRTPVRQNKSKPKYRTVADIEAQGLVVPSVLKSVIIDATGVEARPVASPAGFATPRSVSPDSEGLKVAARAKLGLEAYAASWDVELQNAENLDDEDIALSKEIEMLELEISRQQALLGQLEGSISNNSLEFDATVNRISELQHSYPDEDFSDTSVALIEPSFKEVMIDWTPYSDLPRQLQSLPVSSKPNSTFQQLLLKYWFPQIQDYLIHEWDVYACESAIRLLTTWKPILAPWLYCRVIDSLVLPKLISALREFRRKKSKEVPPLAIWIPEWLALLSQDDYMTSSLSDLRSHLKNSLDSKSWEDWKHLFGQSKSSRLQPEISTPPAARSTQPATTELSFRDLFEEWAVESGLLLQSLRISNAHGQQLFRLKPETGKGVVVYLQDGIVFTEEDAQPYGMDEELLQRVELS